VYRAFEELTLIMASPKAPQNHNGQLNDTKWTPMLQGTSQAIADGSWSTTKDDATWCAGCRRYAASKLCLLLMMPELQRRLDADPILNNISIVSVDPGTMPGNFSRRGPWLMSVFLFRIILPVSARIMALWSSSSMVRTTSQSAADVLQAAFPSEEQQRKGLHLDGSKPCTPSDEARNGETQGYLWQETIGYTQLQQGDTVLRNWK
jgi:thiol-disulfide isomerase/thioredoxin